MLKFSVRESVSPGLCLQCYMYEPSAQSHQAWTPSFCHLPGHGVCPVKNFHYYILFLIYKHHYGCPACLELLTCTLKNVFSSFSFRYNRVPGLITILFSDQDWPTFSLIALRKNVNTVWNCWVTFVCEDTMNLISYLPPWYSVASNLAKATHLFDHGLPSEYILKRNHWLQSPSYDRNPSMASTNGKIRCLLCARRWRWRKTLPSPSRR